MAILVSNILLTALLIAYVNKRFFLATDCKMHQIENFLDAILHQIENFLDTILHQIENFFDTIVPDEKSRHEKNPQIAHLA